MAWLNPCELVGGRIVRMTPTNPTHGRIEVNVAVALNRFVRTRNLGVVMAGMAWVVDPATRTVRVHRSGGEPRSVAAGEVIAGEDVLPGFELPVDEVFE